MQLCAAQFISAFPAVHQFDVIYGIYCWDRSSFNSPYSRLTATQLCGGSSYPFFQILNSQILSSQPGSIYMYLHILKILGLNTTKYVHCTDLSQVYKARPGIQTSGSGKRSKILQLLQSESKRITITKWLFHGYFWPFFCHLHVYLSQNRGSDGQFEVLNGSKS